MCVELSEPPRWVGAGGFGLVTWLFAACLMLFVDLVFKQCYDTSHSARVGGEKERMRPLFWRGDGGARTGGLTRDLDE